MADQMIREEYTPLVSSLIEHIDFSFFWRDGKKWNQIVTIYFLSGAVIEYLAPEQEYINMVNADSIGSYYHKHIKGQFQGKTIKKHDQKLDDI